MRHRPTYEIIPSLTGYWVIRVVDDHGQLIEQFPNQSAAEDFVGFLNHANACSRFLVDHRWTRDLVA